MKLLRLHFGLFNFIFRDFPKQKSLKDKKKFIITVWGIYVKEMTKLVKEIPLTFNKEYQKQKKEYEKNLKVKKQLDNALKILKWFDQQMIEDGYNRQEIRQVWMDFTKSGKVRKEIFDKIYKAINNIK